MLLAPGSVWLSRPAGAAREHSHHIEVAIAHSAKCCCLGLQVEGPHSILFLQQCCCGAYHKLEQEQDGQGHAPHEVPVIFSGEVGVSMVCRHIPGAQNGAADALARDDLHYFLIQILSCVQYRPCWHTCWFEANVPAHSSSSRMADP